MIGRYADADDLRRALDDRIRRAARIQGVAHDRLRKEIAFQRLVARFTAVDRDRWALKGGAALIWRVGAQVRATRDIDSNWFDDAASFGPFFDAALATDLNDAFSFEASQPTMLRGEVEGGHRYRMVAFVAGREFAAFHLDINYIENDQRPVEIVEINVPLLEFMNQSRLRVPMISISQQMSEKLHAVDRRYRSGGSSRPKDAYDTVLIAQTYPIPELQTVRQSVAETFTLRQDPLPHNPPGLPPDWRTDIESYLSDYNIDGVSGFEDLALIWSELWTPILDDTVEATRWYPSQRQWT